jgi:hypothetical protein
MKFRIKHMRDIGCWPQVKKTWFSRWKTIVKHSTGFALLEESTLEFPLACSQDAALVADQYLDRHRKYNAPATYSGIPFLDKTK